MVENGDWNMKAVVFDMDGLMFDTENVFIKAWDYAGEKMGIGNVGYEMVIKTLGMNSDLTKRVWQKEMGDQYKEQDLHKYTNEFLANYYKENKVPVKTGLYILLNYLKEKKCKLAVASSSPKWKVEHHLKDAKVFDYFQIILGGDMIKKSKPDPEIYLKACELLKEQPKDCYALEDSKNGLLSAYNAGCKPIMVPDLWQPEEEIKKIIVGCFEDLGKVKQYFENNRVFCE